MRVHYPKLRNIVHTISLCMLLLLPKDQIIIFYLFAITAAGYLPCGGPKKSPCTPSIVQIIFYLGPLRSVKIFRVFKTLTFRNILLSNV